MEEARIPLVTVHYGAVLGWVLCLCSYTGTSLVPYRQLPNTVTMNTESSLVSIYSNTWYPVTLLDYQNQKRTHLIKIINSYYAK